MLYGPPWPATLKEHEARSALNETVFRWSEPNIILLVAIVDGERVKQKYKWDHSRRLWVTQKEQPK